MLKITLVGLTAGVVGTGLGGLAVVLFSRPSKQVISFLLGLASGVMGIIVIGDLLPHSIEYGNFFITLAGVFLGLLSFSLLAKVIKVEGAGQPRINTGLLVGLGIAIHNFPEGLALGTSYVAEAQLGFGLAVVIALHNFPEGISMAAPLRAGGWRSGKVLAASLLPGLTMGLGAFIGGLLSHISAVLLALNLGLAGGGMLYITLYELLPQAFSLNYGLTAGYGVFSGGIFGLLLVLFF